MESSCAFLGLQEGVLDLLRAIHWADQRYRWTPVKRRSERMANTGLIMKVRITSTLLTV
jgi:hypothetical protein